MPTRCLVVLLAMLTAPAVLADERPLTEAEMVAVLSGRTAISTDPATPYRQYFDPDGETTFVPEGGPPDVGQWRIGAGQYCSHWGGDGWDCYDMIGEGDAITWIWRATGAAFPARMVDGDVLK